MLPGRMISAAWLAVMTLAACAPAANPSTPPEPERVFRVSGSGTALPSARKIAEAFIVAAPGVQLKFDDGTNSTGAIRGVTEGTLDLAIVNRPLTTSETRADLTYRAYALDAMVLTSNAPGIRGLTRAQVAEIYGRGVTHWSELGGEHSEIVALDRDPDESMRKDVFLPLLSGRPVLARTVVLGKASEMLQALEDTPNSIGYTSLGLLTMRAPKGVHVLALDGVSPDPDTLRSGAYPWVLTFGLVYRAEAPPELKSFGQFAVSAAAATILSQFRYLPLPS